MSTKSFHRVEEELLVLDEAHRCVYRLPAELASEAEAVLDQPASSTSRRRFLRALAAGSIAGVAVIVLPSSAAASSNLGEGSSTGDNDEPDLPSSSGDSDPGESTDEDIQVTRVVAGDGSATLEWSDSSV